MRRLVRSGLREDFVEHVDVMHFAVRNADKRWDITAQIQQRVHFDGTLVLAKADPRATAIKINVSKEFQSF